MNVESLLSENRGDPYRQPCESAFLILDKDIPEALRAEDVPIDKAQEALKQAARKEHRAMLHSGGPYRPDHVYDEASDRWVASTTGTFRRAACTEFRVKFPEFSGLSCNMMPFRFGEEEATLPSEYHAYIPMIRFCLSSQKNKSQLGKVGFLTIDERDDLVEVDSASDAKPHRRGGLHTDSPGVYLPHMVPSFSDQNSAKVGSASATSTSSDAVWSRLRGKTAGIEFSTHSTPDSPSKEQIVNDLAAAVTSGALGEYDVQERNGSACLILPSAAEDGGIFLGKPFLLRPELLVPEETAAIRRFRGKSGAVHPYYVDDAIHYLVEQEITKNVFDDIVDDVGQGFFGVRYHQWGIGMVMGQHVEGGIYCCSTVDDTCQVWNCTVEDPRVIGHLYVVYS